MRSSHFERALFGAYAARSKKNEVVWEKESQIVEHLFAGNTEEYEQLCFLVFGEAL